MKYKERERKRKKTSLSIYDKIQYVIRKKFLERQKKRNRWKIFEFMLKMDVEVNLLLMVVVMDHVLDIDEKNRALQVDNLLVDHWAVLFHWLDK